MSTRLFVVFSMLAATLTGCSEGDSGGYPTTAHGSVKLSAASPAERKSICEELRNNNLLQDTMLSLGDVTCAVGGIAEESEKKGSGADACKACRKELRASVGSMKLTCTDFDTQKTSAKWETCEATYSELYDCLVDVANMSKSIAEKFVCDPSKDATTFENLEKNVDDRKLPHCEALQKKCPGVIHEEKSLDDTKESSATAISR